jgi:4,5-DOPA dioxygenase extradiol
MNKISDITIKDENGKMPVIFIGHGSPMNAIEKNEFSQSWIELGKLLPKPKAIMSISAHWLTNGTFVTTASHPATIHDFGGFPDELFDIQYPAEGAPVYAENTKQLAHLTNIENDEKWGLDHGTWSVLLSMFPNADIPVYQLSIDYNKPPQFHYDLARQILALREKGILIMGSGNIVHNLAALRYNREPYDWATEFDQKIAGYIETGDDKSIVNFQKMGSISRMSQPTHDHFLPLLYTLGMKDQKDKIDFFNTGFDLGSISMRSVIYHN